MKQKEALDILKMGNNVFLTGPAGSGKTYVLNKYIEFLKKHDISVGITASTGIAATHIQGITIHSWTGIGIKDELTSSDVNKMTKRSYLKKRFEYARVLIIDEVSMLHHFRLDMVDRVCRAMKKDERPFGGLQVVLCGDFFQLPPVSRGEMAHFVYKSDIWTDMNLQVCYLDEQHRQSDDDLVSVLNDIRGNSVTDDTLQPLRKRYRRKILGDVEATRLYTHNSDVDRINEAKLAQTKGEEEVYKMEGSGQPKLLEFLKSNCLAPQVLRLKKGVVVMFVKNNHDEGYVNGTLGVVTDFDEVGYPIVQTRDGKEIIATLETWTIDDEDQKILAEISQIPLRLAWAITVHKSQGMSLDAVEMDLSKSFEPGMGYVALSRARTLDGLRLLGWGEKAGEVSSEVLRYDEDFKEESEQALSWLKEMKKAIIERRKEEYLESILPVEKEKKISTYDKTRELVTEEMTIDEMAEERGLTHGAILTHLEKLQKVDPGLDISYLEPEKKRMKAMKKAFKKVGDTKLTPVRKELGKEYSYEELRLARLFI